MKCAHIKADGIRCGSPALRGRSFCYFHHHNADHRPRRQTRSVNVPFPEDAASVQVGLYNVMLAIIDRRIEERRAGQLLWALQIAASHSGKLPFERHIYMSQSVTELPYYEVARQRAEEEDRQHLAEAAANTAAQLAAQLPAPQSDDAADPQAATACDDTEALPSEQEGEDEEGSEEQEEQEQNRNPRRKPHPRSHRTTSTT